MAPFILYGKKARWRVAVLRSQNATSYFFSLRCDNRHLVTPITAINWRGA